MKLLLKTLALAGGAAAMTRLVNTIETSANAARRLTDGLLEAEAEARAQIGMTAPKQKVAHADPVEPPARDAVGIHPVMRRVVDNAGFTRLCVAETPFDHVYEARP